MSERGMRFWPAHSYVGYHMEVVGDGRHKTINCH